jgi:hypothetical protein
MREKRSGGEGEVWNFPPVSAVLHIARTAYSGKFCLPAIWRIE